MNRKSGKAFRVFSFVTGGVALVLLMLYMTGSFTPHKIQPGRVENPQGGDFSPTRIGMASLETVTEFYEAVGTIRPRTETRIEAQVMGKILKVLVRAGDMVNKGGLLIVLDSREFEARLEQARQGLNSAASRHKQAGQGVLAAQAVYGEAEAAFKRVRTYFEAEAATAQDLEQAESGFLQTRARLQQAQEGLVGAEAGVVEAGKAVEESTIALGYTRIVATEDGEVVRRLAEAGELALPGRPLLLLQAKGALRLEALVREGLIHRVSQGTLLQMGVSALGRNFSGMVEEVVPSADPMTRTFLVKVGIQDAKGLLPGMFGRLLIPVEERKVVLVPRNAVKRIGQLEMVTVEINGKWQQILVKTGMVLGGKVEVLSGLQGHERLALEGEGDA
ncbi:MAG: efflux RND transporter periplasmic adaptor subunit [Desulfobacterales bacterium]|nr:efflux RND transporter periplasmic adaptor subunit [Desulfobacterales bacterium]